LVDESVREQHYLGGDALAAAIAVAWGLCFPERRIFIWFIIPLTGRVLAWLTVVLTVVFSIYSGWEQYLPELFAEGSMLAYLFQDRIRARWSQTKGSWDRQRVRSARDKRISASKSYLR